MTIRILTFMKIRLGKIQTAYQKVQEIPEVKEVFAITGEYDLAIILEGESGDKLHEIFAGKLDELEGLIESHSHLVMKHKKLK